MLVASKILEAFYAFRERSDCQLGFTKINRAGIRREARIVTNLLFMDNLLDSKHSHVAVIEPFTWRRQFLGIPLLLMTGQIREALS